MNWIKKNILKQYNRKNNDKFLLKVKFKILKKQINFKRLKKLFIKF